MPKTIAITPSWYWPESVDRVAGIPPFAIHELCLLRHARDRADGVALESDEASLTWTELARLVSQCRADLDEARGDTALAVMNGDASVRQVAWLLAALSAGMFVRIAAEDVGEPSGALNLGTMPLPDVPDDMAASLPGVDIREPALAIEGRGGPVIHTQRSLLAGAISMATFLQPAENAKWLVNCSLDRWQGLLSLLLPMYLGETAVLAAQQDGEVLAAAVERYRPGYAVTDLPLATGATREAKRAVKKARDVLSAIFLNTDGVFDPGDRQRVGKSFRCAALTFYGLAETGAIFASHPQWYMDESIGIPVTNAHVVPADPRNGSPIQTLWELVESAEVTVKGPALMQKYENRNDTDYMVDGRFRTGVIASSDANGMIYILPD